MIKEYIVIALLWTAWCFIHSAMISITVTDYLKRILGDGFRFYRLFFNITAAITLVPVFLYSSSIQNIHFIFCDGHLRIIQVAIIITGIILMLVGPFHYDMQILIGIRQIRGKKANTLMSKYGELDTSGILSITRHPWYLAGLILVWAWDMGAPDIIRNIIITAYFFVGTYLEEKKLVDEFGEKYIEYQKNVSMFFPFKWLKARISKNIART